MKGHRGHLLCLGLQRYCNEQSWVILSTDDREIADFCKSPDL